MAYTKNFMRIVDDFKNKKLPLDVELSKKMGSFEVYNEDVRHQEEQTATKEYEGRVRVIYNQAIDQLDDLQLTIKDKINRVFVQTIPSDIVATLENLEHSNPTHTEITAFLEAYKGYPMAIRRIGEVCKKLYGVNSWESMVTQFNVKSVDMEAYNKKLGEVVQKAKEAIGFCRSTDLQLVKLDGNYSNLAECSASIEYDGFTRRLEKEATELDTMLSDY